MIRRYSMRVLVDGVWGTAGGATLTTEKLASTARAAVAHARQYAAGNVGNVFTRVELPPVPVLTGEWKTPVEIDPFTVPLSTQLEQLGALNSAAARVLGIDLFRSSGGFRWIADTRVFASSDGALLVQHAMRALPSAGYISKDDTGFGRGLEFPNYGLASGGFEVVLDPTLMDRMKSYAEDVVRLGRYPLVRADVGRSSVVMEGRIAARLAYILASACEADRALGLEADAAGSTFLAPMEEILGASEPQFSAQLDLRVTPSATKSTSFKWDDDGVLRSSHPLIERGKVTSYTMSRETAAALPSILRAKVTLKGGAVMGYGDDKMPKTLATELTLGHSADSSTLDTLTRDMNNGLLLVGAGGASTDPTLSRSLIGSSYIFQVKNGAIVGRIKDMSLVARTPHLWKQALVAIGGGATVQTEHCESDKGMPWQRMYSVATAPAILVKDIDVIQSNI